MSSNGMWLIGRFDPAVEAALPLPLEVRTVRNARRMRLRIDDSRGILKLTCPPRTSRRAAVRWALEQQEWIAAQLAHIPPSEPFLPGSTILFEGRNLALRWDPAAPRTGRIDCEQLRVGGPEAGFSRHVQTFLRRLALDTLSADVADFAAVAGVTARAVSVGDARSRWGSCSSDGRIRFNWRLILAPVHVRRYVAAHEVAHLRHLNHGTEFRRLEAELVGPGLVRAKADLKALGPRLRRLGRGR